MPRKRVIAPKQGVLHQHLAAALLSLRTTTISIRKCAKEHNVPYSTLQRIYRKPSNTTPRGKQGRRTLFSKAEENVFKNSLLSFSHKGTPLSRECFKDLVRHYVQSLPPQRRSKLPFNNDRPGDGFVRKFLGRHPEVTLKRRTNLEKPRQIAMSPTNLAKHFARLKQVYEEYQIASPEQIFNLDESGFSTRTASRSRAKAMFDARGRSNSVELKWSSNAQHVTIMPVVSADGRAWSPLAVLPGKQAKYRRRSDGTIETPSTFLPPTSYCVYRETAGVDSDIFYRWGQKFVEETSRLRERYRNIVLALDGYGAHCTFKILQLFKENRILVIGLPAHTSHRTQPLDFSVFSPYKSAFRNDLNRRTILVKDDVKNDIYTVCELLTTSYNRAVTFQNIMSGFAACGLWNSTKRSVDASVIKETDITNWEGAETQAAAFRNYHKLVASFTSSCNLLRSDGEVLVNGTLNTTSGLLLTEERVLTELRERERQREQAEKDKERRAAEAEERRLEKQREQVERQRLRAQAERDKQAHQTWLARRPQRALILQASRSARRQTARLRASFGVSDIQGTHHFL